MRSSFGYPIAKLLLFTILSFASSEVMAQSGQKQDATSSKQSPNAEQMLAEFSKAWDESKWQQNFRGNQYMRATGEEGWVIRAKTMKQLVAGGDASIPALEKYLTSDHAPTRILAAQSIGYLAPKANIQKLTDIANNDADPAVRLYAVDALGMSGKGEDIDWDALSKSQRNRDVIKHIHYAKTRQSKGVEDSVVNSLAQLPEAAINSAKVGEQAPDFTLSSVDGTEFSLSQFKGKQPVVLIFIYGDT